VLSEIFTKRQQQFIDTVTIYPVSCEKLCNGRSDGEWLDAVLAGGAKIVQLRDKESEDRLLLEKARTFRRKTAEAGALFILNDRVDIAMLVGADGLHLGQNDLPAEEVRQLVPDMLIGVSCNREEDVIKLGRQQAAGMFAASYYNIGPLFATGTKKGLKEFIGPEAIATFSRHCELPFTVMGGIKKEHIGELTSFGAQRIAVVTAITQAEDMAAATRELIGAVTSGLASD
jgi:thiamine-phosphate pyrophosphorylase